MATSLFSGFRELLNQFIASPEDPSAGEDDLVVSIAALMFHVVSADGVVTDGERRSLDQVLQDDYGLSREQASRVSEAGRRANDEAVDLYRFTSTLKRRLSHEDRLAFVHHLWEVTYADGELHELEDNVVWRVSELLGISSRERMLLKREVADSAGH